MCLVNLRESQVPRVWQRNPAPQKVRGDLAEKYMMHRFPCIFRVKDTVPSSPKIIGTQWGVIYDPVDTTLYLLHVLQFDLRRFGLPVFVETPISAFKNT